MKSEKDLRRAIVQVCKQIHQKGWISSTDGNVSARLANNRLLITPTGIHKGFMDERDLIVVDMEGNLIRGTRQPSSEILLHLTCYCERPDIQSVVHAHPTMCVAFSMAGITLAKCLLPEVVFTLGAIPTANYAPPSTQEVADSIRCHVKEHDAIILERHGSLTVGKDVFAAYNTLERMEHVAEMTYYARQIGEVRPLEPRQIEELQRIGEAHGWARKKVTVNERCNNCNACGKLAPERNNGAAAPDVERVVEEEVARALAGRG
ncbi:MAG: class II aldolase/adducin family protein [Nitrospinae bacterium]|nr:class II aldolase/adducin family protein [Nitrospinota bacterium]